MHANSHILETGASIAVDVTIVCSIPRNTSKTTDPAGMMDFIMPRCKKYGHGIN